jgi:hypothetical protein
MHYTCLGISAPEADLAIVDVVVRVSHGERERREGTATEEAETRGERRGRGGEERRYT